MNNFTDFIGGTNGLGSNKFECTTIFEGDEHSADLLYIYIYNIIYIYIII